MKKLYDAFFTFSRGKQITISVCTAHLLALFFLFGHHLLTRTKKIKTPILVRTVVVYPERKETPPLAIEPRVNQQKMKPALHLAAKHKAPPKKEATQAPKAKKRSPLTLPTKIETKPPLPETAVQPEYGEWLIGFLQNSLDLPEYGEVKATLEIDRFGKLVKCEILETKSTKNAAFLQSELPDLLFPYFTDFGILGETQTFTITFRNVENR